MRFTYFLLTIPFYFMGLLCKKFNFLNLRNDLELCIRDIQNNKLQVPYALIHILSIAEDHRVQKHFGIDHYAMLRSIYCFCWKKHVQGASTIAQQYVRVKTGRYERTLVRKFREQLLAVLLSRRFNWKQLALAYLDNAFFGTEIWGIVHFSEYKKINIEECSIEEGTILIARLKYPEPQYNDEAWVRKISSRISYIKLRFSKGGFE